MDEYEKRRIQRLLRLDVDGLLSLLPAYDPDYRDVLFAPRGQLQAGREIFERLRSQLHQCVCVDWRYCEKRNLDKYQDSVTLVASVADVVAAVTMGIPPFVIATLLLKIGLSNFCECDS